MVVKIDEDLPWIVLYLRMSDAIQEMSIEDQREYLNKFFAGKFKIIHEYVDEGKSGSKDIHKREKFLRMIHDVTVGKYAGKVVNIGCYDTSRFGRLNSIKGAKYKEQLMDAGIVLRTYADGDYDWRKSFDRIVDGIRSENNHEKSLTVGRTSLRGRIRVTKAGRPNQTTPYGMAKRVTSPTGETIIVKRGQKWATPKTWDSEFCAGDAVEVEAMKYMFETFDTEDITYNELARKMDAKGYPSPTGIGWLGETIRDYLQNPVYSGALRIGQNPKGAFFRTSQGEVTEKADALKTAPVVNWDAHTGIIDKALFDRVQRKAERIQKKREPRLKRGPYALTGVIHCGECKKPMYGSRLPDGRIVYKCHHADRGHCGYWLAYEQEILPVVMGQFLVDLRKEIEAQLSKGEPVPVDDEEEKLKKKLEKLEQKLVTYRERFLEASKSTAAGLHAMLEKLETEKLELLEQIKQQSKTSKDNRVWEWWTKYCEEFAAENPMLVLDEPWNGCGGTTEWVVIKTKLPASVLREKLKKIDTKVFVWFQRKEKGRGYFWTKIRATANIDGELQVEYASNADS